MHESSAPSELPNRNGVRNVSPIQAQLSDPPVMQRHRRERRCTWPQRQVVFTGFNVSVAAQQGTGSRYEWDERLRR